MWLKIFSTFFLIIALTVSGEDNYLDISVMNLGGPMGVAYRYLATEFRRRHPGVKVRFHAENDANYKNKLIDWLMAEKGVDVLYWQAGERLFGLVRKNYIKPIDALWKQQQWNTAFSPAMQNLVKYQENFYGVPFSYYHWAIYYKKSVFKKLSVTPPKDWKSFLDLCKKLRSSLITPIALGNKFLWPAEAWFDYINLRVNGIEFHQSLLAGKISYKSPQVMKVFSHWKQLIDNNCFSALPAEYDWYEVIPELSREKAAMMLIGHFITTKASNSLLMDLDFFPFPEIDTAIPHYEEAPTDIFTIPHNAKNVQLAEQFLIMLAEPAVQTKLNEMMKFLPPRLGAVASGHMLTKKGKDLLDQAKGITQYFDRDAPKPMVDIANQLFAEFLQSANIEEITDKLETARQSIYNQNK